MRIDPRPPMSAMARATRWMAALVAALVFALGAARASAQPTCVACHRARAEAHLRAPVDALAADVHGHADIRCVDCHGGDPDEPTMRAHAFAEGFVGAGDPLVVVTVCGRCHGASSSTADAGALGEGAPAVLAAFRDGAHGRALANGSHAAATCTSCHGAHGVEAADAEGALTERGHVAALCGSCHADRERLGERLGGTELRTEVVAEYEGSVHGRAVREGDPSAPTCVSCHGPHQNAAGTSATLACATCHLEVRVAFDEGPHAEAFARLGFADCAECHGSHAVEPASAALLVGMEAACLACHDRSSPVLDQVRELQAMGGRLEGLRRATERDDPRRREAILAFHRLDASALASVLEGVPEAPLEAPEEARAPAPRQGSSGRLIAAAIALAIAIVAAVILWRRRSR